ncbi:isoprenylcysteine carboxyl methyltransferase family protein [Streptomyces aureocirculatus]|uniref:isoprenylcysteine carboxyl methyltransferase family protein n=1 Tax=Streptomyces aureocirculatus TaxID=67275 RepID=UPI00056677FB|nr:isoprenylcysteine carboxyl methyltransferase family protein [Streptomyces aureocirculatus]
MTLPASLILLIAAVTAVRLVELAVARRNARWAFDRGGVEYGQRHYPAMVVLHVFLLVGILAEVALADRTFTPLTGWPCLAVLALAQAGRAWCMRALGPQWNTRVIVVPTAPLVTTGPYRWMRHPNYLVVACEGIALPLVHTAWITAFLFTLANTAWLAVRIRTENTVLWPAAPEPAVCRNELGLG